MAPDSGFRRLRLTLRALCAHVIVARGAFEASCCARPAQAVGSSSWCLVFVSASRTRQDDSTYAVAEGGSSNRPEMSFAVAFCDARTHTVVLYTRSARFPLTNCADRVVTAFSVTRELRRNKLPLVIRTNREILTLAITDSRRCGKLELIVSTHRMGCAHAVRNRRWCLELELGLAADRAPLTSVCTATVLPLRGPVAHCARARS